MGNLTASKKGGHDKSRWISLKRPSGSLLDQRQWISFRRPVDHFYVDDRTLIYLTRIFMPKNRIESGVLTLPIYISKMGRCATIVRSLICMTVRLLQR